MRNEYRAYLQQCKEQESLYHQIALSLGLPDSVLYLLYTCLLYTSPSPRDRQKSRMPSSA